MRLWYCIFLIASTLPVKADLLGLDDEGELGTSWRHEGLPRLRLSVDVGYAKQDGISQHDSALTSEGKKFNDTRTLGKIYSVDIAFFPWRLGGIGIVAERQYISAGPTTIQFYKTNSPLATYQIRETTDLIGPIFWGRIKPGFGLFMVGVGGGYVRWRATGYVNGIPIEYAHDTWGLIVRGDWDLQLFGPIVFGVGARGLMATSNYIRRDGQKIVLETQNSGSAWIYTFSRIEATAGLRVAF